MQNQKPKNFLKYSLLVASLIVSASSVKSQCPRKIALTLTASTPNVFNADFNSVQLGAPRAWLNDPAINKGFLYTFQWAKAEKCCEVTSAILTVNMKANQPGASKTSSDAGNDGIAIMYLGGVVSPFSESVYSSWPFPAGQTATKTWNLTGAALAHLNATGRVSIWVEDDTKVISATLQISGCCLTTTPLSAP